MDERLKNMTLDAFYNARGEAADPWETEAVGVLLEDGNIFVGVPIVIHVKEPSEDKTSKLTQTALTTLVNEVACAYQGNMPRAKEGVIISTNPDNPEEVNITPAPIREFTKRT